MRRPLQTAGDSTKGTLDSQFALAATLESMKYIGEHSSSTKPTLSRTLQCPRRGAGLTLAHNMARNVRFVYWQCPNQHGHFITFFEFLKEKNFIHPLSVGRDPALPREHPDGEQLELRRGH